MGDAVEIENDRETKKSSMTNIKKNEAYIDKLKRQKILDGIEAKFSRKKKNTDDTATSASTFTAVSAGRR